MVHGARCTVHGAILGEMTDEAHSKITLQAKWRALNQAIYSAEQRAASRREKGMNGFVILQNPPLLSLPAVLVFSALCLSFRHCASYSTFPRIDYTRHNYNR